MILWWFIISWNIKYLTKEATKTLKQGLTKSPMKCQCKDNIYTKPTLLPINRVAYLFVLCVVWWWHSLQFSYNLLWIPCMAQVIFEDYVYDTSVFVEITILKLKLKYGVYSHTLKLEMYSDYEFVTHEFRVKSKLEGIYVQWFCQNKYINIITQFCWPYTFENMQNTGQINCKIWYKNR